MAAAEIAAQTACFLNQQGAGGHVPLGQAEFPEGIKAACSYVGKVQAGGAGAADAGGLADQATEHAQVVVQRIDLIGAEREAGAQQGAIQGLAGADTQAAAVQCCAAAAAGGELFLANRIQHDGVLNAALYAAGDADGKVRYTANEVGGAVQRVDDPDSVGAFAMARLEAAFLGLNAVVGIGLAQLADNGLLGGAIHFRHIIARVLFVHGEHIKAFHGTVNELSCAARGTQGDVQHGLHKAMSLSGE